MPYIPSGILYFMVWKYLLYTLLLVGGTFGFKALGLFETHPYSAITFLSVSAFLVIGWLEYGDKRLIRKWGIDKERQISDRLLKAFIYVCCCMAWPKFIMNNES